MTASTKCRRPAVILATNISSAAIHQVVSARAAGTERVVDLDAMAGWCSTPAPRRSRASKCCCRAGARRSDRRRVRMAARWRDHEDRDAVRDQDGAALIIDYGHLRSDAGDTFQAIARPQLRRSVKNSGQAVRHRPRRFPGAGARSGGCGGARSRPGEQGEFLKRLGIGPGRHADGQDHAGSIRHISSALKRLTQRRDGMGSMFKVLAITERASPRWRASATIASSGDETP